jgi:hypothetical protein
VLARHADRDAALLALPEVAWTAFATVLSAAVAAGNLPSVQPKPAAAPAGAHRQRSVSLAVAPA